MKNKYFNFDLAFFCAAILLGVLHCRSWSEYPPDVDPINFTVALHTFSPSNDSPHPPGYPLFVFAARMAGFVVGGHHAYQLVNLGMLLAACGFLYFIFRRAKHPLLGIYSALLLMSHPLAWAATVVPECYISDTFFACAILTWVLTQSGSQARLIVGSFILFFLLGMVRPVSGVMLLPLAMTVCFLYSDCQRHRATVLVAVAGITAIALAYCVTAYLSGGLTVYRSAALRVMGGAFRASSVFGGATFTAHLKMLVHFGGWFLFLALPAGVTLCIVAFQKRCIFVTSRYHAAIMIGCAWLLPPLMFYSLIYYLKPSYQLIYLPCLLIPVAWALTPEGGLVSKRIAGIVFPVLVALQLSVFFLPIPHLPQPLFRQTHAYVVQQNQAWGYLLANLANMPKEDTLLVWISHPTLTVYAVRLLDREGPIALTQASRSEVKYAVPKTMEWLPPSPAEKIIDNKYTGAIIIEDIGGKAVIRYVPLAGPQWHEVDYLLQHYVAP